ncbi:fibronectin type III domain-containing protein [Pontiella sulfatireligans]|uniref:Amylopullulanase n=1 Tax=Pontiella sulfatireligans TaxID=2750658 RepID=A0A6C2UEC0_9BACT|nr:fibronectin type III domain-containing protein [Pontiella sulfatireligans]VGO18213.1 Amylopullulanase [Pontiella sulfatireligans]
MAYFLIQQDGGADFLDSSERFDATIDSISLDETTGVAPVLIAPTASAIGLNGEVVISWSDVSEAETYDVEWSSTSNGTYAAVATGVTSNSVTHSSLSNGTVYWYKVTAQSAGATGAVSSPVSAEPLASQTGVLIDTTFIQSEGYANGTLHGQQVWRDNINSVPGAFAVADNTGDGFAVGYASAAKTNDSSVFLTMRSDNAPGATWSGSIAFTMGATNAPTVEKDGEDVAIINDGNPYVYGEKKSRPKTAG